MGKQDDSPWSLIISRRRSSRDRQPVGQIYEIKKFQRAQTNSTKIKRQCLNMKITSIVCAASAPSEGIAFNGQKNNESNIVCNFDGREQNVTKVSFPSVYNVVQNSSDCVKPRNIFFYDKIIKQYQISKSNSCSIMERVPLEKNKTDSKVDFVYRKRNLLWDMDQKKYNFRTLRPPVSQGFGCSPLAVNRPGYCQKKQKSSKTMTKIKTMWKNFRKPKKINSNNNVKEKKKNQYYRKINKPTDKNKFALDCNERKMLFCLKHMKTKDMKKPIHALHLDTLEVDEELDLNKRIEKLVEQLAAENHQRKDDDDEALGSVIRGRDSSKAVFIGEDDFLPLFDSIKKMFKLSKSHHNNKILDVNTVPVRILEQGRQVGAEKGENTASSSGILKTKRKSNRLRRNPHKSHNSYKYKRNKEPKYNKNSIEQSNPHGASFKAKTFVRRRDGRNARKRWMRKRMSRNRRKNKTRDCPFVNNFQNFETLDESSKCQCNCPHQNRTTPKPTEPSKHKVTTTKAPRIDSQKDKDFNFDLGALKNIDEVFRSTTSEASTTAQTESTTENEDERPVTQSYLFPAIPLEKPILEKDQKKETDKGVKNLDNNAATELPSQSPAKVLECSTEHSSRKHFKAFPFLKIRHMLRDYIIHKKMQDTKKANHLYKRKKRFGSKTSSSGRKNWRSAPLLCIPYIRKGQEDQLKFLIKVMQNMMGKPFPPKCDIFEKSKSKPDDGEGNAGPRNFGSDDDETNSPLRFPYKYSLPLANANFFHQSSPRHSPADPKIAYDPDNPKHDDFSGSSPTPIPSGFPLTTTAAPRPSQNTNSVCFHLIGGKNGSPANRFNPDEKLPPPESHFRPTAAPVPFAPTPPSDSTTHPSESTIPPTDPTTPTTSTTTPAPAVSSDPAPSVAPDHSSPSPLPEPSAVAAAVHPSTVNSVLQESKGQNENEGTSGTTTGRGEDSTTMISHFSGASSEKPSVQRLRKQDKAGDQEPAANHDVDACRTNVNKSTLSAVDRSNSKFRGSQYRAPSLANYKGLEMYSSAYPSHVTWSKNKGRRREFEANQKFFGKEEGEVSYYGKDDHLYKKRNLKQHFKGDKKSSFWGKLFKGNYHLPFRKASVPHEEEPTSTTFAPVCDLEILKANYPQVFNYNMRKMKYPLRYIHKQQKGKDPALGVFVSKRAQQPYGDPGLRKFENLFLRPHQKDKGPLIHRIKELNPSFEQDENYHAGRHSTRSQSAKTYDAEEKDFLKRQKRDDYYFWPDDYSEYFYDPNYSDEDSRTQAPLKETNPDSNWTPPSYDMFSELAKAVLQNEDSVSEDRTDSYDLKSNSTIKPAAMGEYEKQQYVEGATDSATQVTEKELYSEEPLLPCGKAKNKGKESKKSFDCIMKHSGNPKHLVDANEVKGTLEEDVIAAENGRGPTTLKSASIVKGQKKVLTKPSPKVYTKVFPDSFENEGGSKEEVTTTTARTTESINLVKSTEQPLSPKNDLRLQVLAVCEGYLEVVKLIKAQNQTLGEDVDENLARYCENIISQNFNFQSEKTKKSELSEALIPSTNKRDSEKGSDANELTAGLTSAYKAGSLSSRGIRLQPSDNLVAKRELKKITNENLKWVRSKKRRNSRLPCRHYTNSRKKIRKKKETDEEAKKKGITTEQVQLIRLLKKRKKALLSWLLNSKDGVKPDVLKETEYLDDEDLMDQEADISQYSGTIKPRTEDKNSGTPKKSSSSPNATIFPVYAKDYGYESGGELIEVEVLWRQVNDKTHENKIFKNVSVLALLLTSTSAPRIKHEETKLVGDENEDVADTKWKGKNKLAFDAAKLEAESDKTSTTSTTMGENGEGTTSTPESVIKRIVKASAKTNRNNNTHIIISKPDPTSIVGAPTNANKTHRKPSHKYGVAKDLFQEYSIEFLNYAVYILPMMFTILFLLCCLCCALQILKTQKSHKKRKKKKKKADTSDDSSNSCSTENEKKRKREAKRKRNAESKENYESTHKKKSKTFWNYLKVGGKTCSEVEEENDQTEKKKSFLGFLKGKRDEFKPEYASDPNREASENLRNYTGNRERKHYSDQCLTGRERRREEERRKHDGQSEAAERRELIALLEELKKIETEHIEGKKDVKSVHVQYVTPEYDNPVLQSRHQVPDFSYPYEKNVFGMPKGICPFSSKKFQFLPAVPPASGDYNLYEDVNELSELLPWGGYSQSNDLLKRCDIKINQRARCDRFLKIFRDSGMSCNKPVVEKNCKKDESENRSFIFNKYRSIRKDRSEELMGVTPKISGTELTENAPPYKISSENDEDLVEDAENLKSQLNKKKYVGLKDEGVLCRL